MTDVDTEAGSETSALETSAHDAVAAIEAVLERRCPALKTAFWSAVAVRYACGAAESTERRNPKERHGFLRSANVGE